MKLELIFCETCNCNHGMNSATCLALEFQSFADASDCDLFRFEEELDAEEEE